MWILVKNGLCLRQRQRDVDAHGLGVVADVARVALAAEDGLAALWGAGVVRAGLDLTRGHAEAVGRADRAIRDGLEAVEIREGAQWALGELAVASAVQGWRAGLAHGAARVSEITRRTGLAAGGGREGLVGAGGTGVARGGGGEGVGARVAGGAGGRVDEGKGASGARVADEERDYLAEVAGLAQAAG